MSLTPREIAALLLKCREDQGRHLLQQLVPRMSLDALEQLVNALKMAADRYWLENVSLSFVLSGYVLLIGELSGNGSFYALGLMTRGDALRGMERHEEALPFFDAAGEEFLALHDLVGWARSRLGRISSCMRLNRMSEALRDAAAAREIFLQTNNLIRVGQLDVNTAIIHFELGQYEQALRYYDRAIEAYMLHGVNVDRLIARALANKAMALAALGRFHKAVELHQEACETFKQYGTREEISLARQYLNIADIYTAQGRYSQALMLYNRCLPLFREHQMTFAEAEVLLQMCLCLLRLNRTEEAYEMASDAVAMLRTQEGQDDSLARALMYQARAAIHEHLFEEAALQLQEASTLLLNRGLTRLAAQARFYRAELAFSIGEFEESKREVRYAADAFAEQEDVPLLAQAMLLEAHIADVRGEAEAARVLCLHALDLAEKQELFEVRYRCHALLGKLAASAGKDEEAGIFYDLAIKGIDEIQSRLILDERSSFLEDKGAIYQQAVELALQRGYLEQAFIYVEKAKSSVLGDYVRNNIDIRLRADEQVSDELLEELARLREEQAWYSSIVYETVNEANLSDTALMRIRTIGPVRAREEMRERERQIERLLEQIRLSSAHKLLQTPALTNDLVVFENWACLPSGTLLLEYYLTEQDLLIFQLTCNGIEVERVSGARPQLERLLTLWRANLDLAAQAATLPEREREFASLQENGLGLLKRLHALLIRPVVVDMQRVDHLIVVPYGMLHYLPFHCLFDGTRFLVERVQISYLPSLTLLDICLQRGARSAATPQNIQHSLVLGVSDQLPFVREEASVVARCLNAPCVLDQEATVSLLQARSSYSPVVHIAAHGLFRLDAPDFSFISLADRQLNTFEAFNLDLSLCSLLTLSACETGRASIGGIDEVIGLGRGFLYAGAASLLPTLWKVDDASSAELMEMFYRQLLQGATKAGALAQAQRAFLLRARASLHPYRLHPYFWGAFQLIGDPGPLLA
ncbi:tetratricopeptide repeat protein [Thermosporothrix hazakensis]|uniref:Tetratricopeptide repeat protein n=2 Tax=Thermosporothrix TaxID=768650 RepID=A0A326UCA9_THEHA|nr:tetratricopeptide repeat protein [Thermosporothrix hazakensis]BBH88435.1 hypothetical protein KTC_31860 [Thermosporothrix sp. COM3]GCE46621.1 hypothetical protein KTH_14900 [Thermosporothrix hazakensis]